MTPTTEQVQQIVQQALSSFEQLASSDDAPAKVVPQLLSALTQALRAEGAAAWMPADANGSRFLPIAAVGASAQHTLDEQKKGPIPPVHAAVHQSWSQRRVIAAAPGQAEFLDTALGQTTQFYIPVETAGRLLAVLQLLCGADLDPKVYREYAGFAQHAARALALYLNKRHSQLMQQDAEGRGAQLRAVHQLLMLQSPHDVVHELANLARPLLAAQRVAVVGYWRGRTEIAFSNTVDVNRKAVLVRAVELLADAARQRGVPMVFSDDQQLTGDDEPLAPLLDDLFNLGDAQAVCLTPIRFEQRIVGVLIAEYGSVTEASQRASHQQELAGLAGPVLEKAILWHTRPLRRTSQLIGSVRDKPVAAAVRSLAVLAVVAGAIYGLFFMPVTIPVRGDARLEPAMLAMITSPYGGRIDQVHVTAGQQVRQGDVLVSLDDSDLRLQLAEVTRGIDQEHVRQQQARREGNITEVRATELKIAQLEIRRRTIERLIERAHIRAPIDGVVLNERPQHLKGMTVPEGDQLLQLGDLKRFDLVVEVNEDDLILVEQSLRNGRPVPVEFLSHASPDDVETATIEHLTALSPTSTLNEMQTRHVYRLTAPIELKGISAELALANRTGRAKLDTGQGSVAKRYFRGVWRFVRMTVMF